MALIDKVITITITIIITITIRVPPGCGPSLHHHEDAGAR
jgi:hypothetical protein